jgi:hypothetical protein
VAKAMNEFTSGEAMTRHGVTNPYAGYRSEVLATARRLLSQALTKTRSLQPAETASYVTVLSTFGGVAEPQDLPLIAAVLDRAKPDGIRETAVMVARRYFLHHAEGHAMLVPLLIAAVFDESRPLQERADAAWALADTVSASAEDALLHAVQLDPPWLQAHAAVALAERDLEKHRRLLETLADSWPADLGFPASEVRELLAGEA